MCCYNFAWGTRPSRRNYGLTNVAHSEMSPSVHCFGSGIDNAGSPISETAPAIPKSKLFPIYAELKQKRPVHELEPGLCEPEVVSPETRESRRSSSLFAEAEGAAVAGFSEPVRPDTVSSKVPDEGLSSKPTIGPARLPFVSIPEGWPFEVSEESVPEGEDGPSSDVLGEVSVLLPSSSAAEEPSPDAAGEVPLSLLEAPLFPSAFDEPSADTVGVLLLAVDAPSFPWAVSDDPLLPEFPDESLSPGEAGSEESETLTLPEASPASDAVEDELGTSTLPALEIPEALELELELPALPEDESGSEPDVEPVPEVPEPESELAPECALLEVPSAEPFAFASGLAPEPESEEPGVEPVLTRAVAPGSEPEPELDEVEFESVAPGLALELTFELGFALVLVSEGDSVEPPTPTLGAPLVVFALGSGFAPVLETPPATELDPVAESAHPVEPGSAFEPEFTLALVPSEEGALLVLPPWSFPLPAGDEEEAVWPPSEAPAVEPEGAVGLIELAADAGGADWPEADGSTEAVEPAVSPETLPSALVTSELEPG